LAKKGIYIPSQTGKLTESLLKLIREYKPDRLVLLGDVKQAVSKISMGEWRDIPEFFEDLEGEVEEVIVTLGNHDGDLEPLTPRSVKIHPSSGTVLDMEARVGLFHGHAWPSPEVLSSDILIMGHIHPVVRFRDRLGLWTIRQVWLRTRCDGDDLAKTYLGLQTMKAEGYARELFYEKFALKIGDPSLIIMPSFNDLLGGLSVNHAERRLMGVLLRSESVKLDDFEAYLLDGTFLGKVHRLRHLSRF